MLVLLLLACARPPTTAPPSGESTYDVAVLAASGDRIVTSIYALRTQVDAPGTVTFTTLSSEGSWEEGGRKLDFRSDSPSPSDPWPLALQHAVSEVPTATHFADGMPTALVDDAGWRTAALAAVKQAIAARDLPPEALTTGRQLVDPSGVVRDLQRNFPGNPPDGLWRRTISIAGVPARLQQSCVRDGPRTRSCTGRAEGPTEGTVRLHEVDVTTRIQSDGAGLVQLEQDYGGTLVYFDPAEDQVLDRPIGGKRLVLRR